MNRRIQRALDGELPVERLSDAERAELAAYQATVEQVLSALPEAEAVPDLTGPVMWRIAHGSPHAVSRVPERQRLTSLLARAGQWLWRPRAIQLRPASALAALAVLVIAVLSYELPQPASPAGVAAASADQPRLLVQFRLGADGARDVALVGDFSGWQERYQLEEIAPGVWTTTVPLEPGVYDYAFVVDGSTWVLDPLAPSVSDGFGGANSRLSVLAPEPATRT